MAESFCTQCFQLLVNNYTSSVSEKCVHEGGGTDLGVDLPCIPRAFPVANRTSGSFWKEVA